MEGIVNVEQTNEFARIVLDDDFYLVLNRDGLIVCRDDGAETGQDSHAHLDWEAADQVARTIHSARTMYERR